MSGRSRFEIAVGAAPPKANRTFQPVRHSSYPVGKRECRIWRPIRRNEISARMRAAEEYNCERK